MTFKELESILTDACDKFNSMLEGHDAVHFKLEKRKSEDDIYIDYKLTYGKKVIQSIVLYESEKEFNKDAEHVMCRYILNSILNVSFHSLIINSDE